MSTSRTDGTRILLVDDDPLTLESIALGLEGAGFLIDTARSAHDATQRLATDTHYALLVSDLQLGKDNGLELCAHARQVRPGMPAILVTGHASVKTAIEAMRQGVWDYLTKPVSLDELELQVRRAIEHSRLTDELARLRQGARLVDDQDFLGQSAVMRDLKELVTRVAATDVGV